MPEWRKRQESNLPGTLLRASLVLKTRHPTGDIALPLQGTLSLIPLP